MSTVEEFLLARIAEDEAAARAVIEGNGPTIMPGQTYEDGSGTADYPTFPSYPWGSLEFENDFITAWCPERVLAECESKRALLDTFIDIVDIAERAWHLDPFIDLAISHMTLPYRGHPDFDPDWVVEE